MVKESYAHAREDMTAHRLIDVRNEAHRVLVAVEKSLANAAGALSSGQRAALDAAVADLRNLAASSSDPDVVYEAMRLANDAASPLTQVQMDEVLKKTVTGRKPGEITGD
jgi:molecular chaperone HscA